MCHFLSPLHKAHPSQLPLLTGPICTHLRISRCRSEDLIQSSSIILSCFHQSVSFFSWSYLSFSRVFCCLALPSSSFLLFLPSLILSSFLFCLYSLSVALSLSSISIIHFASIQFFFCAPFQLSSNLYTFISPSLSFCHSQSHAPLQSLHFHFQFCLAIVLLCFVLDSAWTISPMQLSGGLMPPGEIVVF